MLRRSGKMDGNVRCDKIWEKSLSSGNRKFTNNLVSGFFFLAYSISENGYIIKRAFKLILLKSVTIRKKQQQQHRRNQKLACGITHAISAVKDIRELKQQTFAIHGGQPELKLHKSCALRMSHGRRGLSRRAPMNFSRPCRFATILILHGFLRRQR